MNYPNINKLLPFIQKLVIILILINIPNILKSASLLDIKSKIEKEYYSFNISSHSEIVDLLNNYPNDNDIKNYYLSFEFHILGKIVYNDNPDLALEYFEKSIEHIESAISKITKENKILLSEFYAIHSSALGKKSSLSGLTAFYWGLKSQNAYSNAYDSDSTNRKVRLIGAIHLMHVPEVLGGDKKKAKKVLEKLREKELTTKNKYELIWSDKAEIFAYLAQIEILNNKKQIQYIDSALYYQAKYDFVTKDLIIQIKKKD
jgi:hypothetical protein